MPTPITRRGFLAGAGAAASAALLGPRIITGMPAGEKLRLATVGSGGMGGSDLGSLASHPALEVVALCDVDENTLNGSLKKFPNAKPFRDFRKMFDAMAKEIDLVNVGTPDHMHAAIAMTALQLDIHEARKLTEVARAKKLVTQMGIQINSAREYRTAVRLIQDGAIGKVKEVHSWSDKKWGFDGPRPEGADPVPANLDWDLWLGTAPERPYKNGLYHPANWRKWLDFGCGTMGDMSIHILDPVAGALALTYPKAVVSDSPEPPKESFATKNKVRYTFPGTKYTVDPLPLTWYDGDSRPDASAWPMPKNKDGKAAGVPGQGSMFVGEKGFMLLPHVGMPQLLPQDAFKDFAVPKVDGLNHWHSWVDGCRGKGAPTANFDYAGPLTEFVLLGVVANRVPGKTLGWDAATLKITGSAEAQAFVKRTYRKGWEIKGL
jgi:hypothetical protein